MFVGHISFSYVIYTTTSMFVILRSIAPRSQTPRASRTIAAAFLKSSKGDDEEKDGEGGSESFEERW